MASKTTPHYFDALTGLRFFAACWVVAIHFTPDFYAAGLDPTWFRALIGGGWSAVDLFFILSGFILCHTYPKRDSGKAAYKAFIVRRFARIWPAHAFVLLAMLAYIAATWMSGKRIPEAHASDFVSHFFLVQAWANFKYSIWNAPTWTLSAEWGVYLMFPLLLWLGVKVGAGYRAISAAILCLCFMVFSLVYSGWDILNAMGGTLLPRAGVAIFLGVLLYQLAKARPKMPHVGLVADVSTFSILPFGLLLGLLGFEAYWVFPLFALSIWSLSYGKGKAAAILGTPTMVFLGNVSFAVYLVHRPLQTLMASSFSEHKLMALGPWYGALAIGGKFLIIFIVALLVYFFVEKPARIALVRRFGK